MRVIENAHVWLLYRLIFCHRIGPLRMSYSMILTLIFKVKLKQYPGKGKNYHKNVSYELNRGWYLPSNDTTVKVVVCDLDLHLQGQIFYCYAFVIKTFTGNGCPWQICLGMHGSPWSWSCLTFGVEFKVSMSMIPLICLYIDQGWRYKITSVLVW